MKVNQDKNSLFYWTKHAQAKLRQYGLSASRVKRLIRHPERIEAGIAPETWASMQTAGSKKHPYEIWTMYVIEKSKVTAQLSSPSSAYAEDKLQRGSETSSQRKRGIPVYTGMTMQNHRLKTIKVISAWKYPGKTDPGDPIPIPPDIFEEIMESMKRET